MLLVVVDLIPVEEDLIVDDDFLDCFELVLASTDMLDELFIIPFTPLLLFVAIHNFDVGDLLLLFSCINSLVKFIVDNAYGALLFCLFYC